VNEADQVAWIAIEYAMSRLAEKNDLANRFFFDCNPPSKKHWLYIIFKWGLLPEKGKKLEELQDFNMKTFMTKLNPQDNLENIDGNYISDTLQNMSKARRKKFLEGEFGDTATGVLWDDSLFQRNRVDKAPPLDIIVVSVDPNVTSGSTSDDCGIVVGGLCLDDGCVYIIEDATKTGDGPTKWIKRSVAKYKQHHANYILAETNQGGELVAICIKSEDRSIPIRTEHVMNSKHARAEPVVELYEAGKVKHVGEFEELETECVEYDPDSSKKSPNRLDALVLLVTKLLIKRGGGIHSSTGGDSSSRRSETHSQAVERITAVLTQADSMSFQEIVENEELWNCN